MKKTKTLLYVITILIVFFTGAYLFFVKNNNHRTDSELFNGRFGSFLAATHAMYVTDYENALKFVDEIPDADAQFSEVGDIRVLMDFFNGNIPESVSDIKDSDVSHGRIIYDAYLVKNGGWNELYERHKSDKSALFAPFRIWSGIATDHKSDVLKFINEMDVTESWKDFVRGQIYAQIGDVESAKKSFSKIDSDFLNINDYLYIMSFYKKYELNDFADELQSRFIERAGGVLLPEYNNIPSWNDFIGINNQLGFCLLQTVSHTRMMRIQALSMLLLHFVQITAGTSYDDAINYYIGQFLFDSGGDYRDYFLRIPRSSPFYLFGKLRLIDSEKGLKKMVRDNPLFVPAINDLVKKQISNGDKRSALKTINKSLKNKDISEVGKRYLTKMRANVYYVFGELDKAKADIFAYSYGNDTDILSLQAKIWTDENRELERAYEYAMELIKKNPMDVMAWDTLGYVVATREGVDAALEILEQVGEMADECSSLFEHLGDLYVIIGDIESAKISYSRALELSGDGLTVVPFIEKKLRNLK